MDEYISRHEAIRAAQLAYGDYEATRKAIYEIPAADVAPVVRCPECKHHKDNGVHVCKRLRMNCPNDSEFFCKYGARMGGAK